VDDLAILAHIAVLEIGLGLSLHHLVDRLQRTRPIGVEHEVGHRPADHFRRRIAENALARGTDKNKTSPRVDNADRVEQQIHDVAGGVANSFHVVVFMAAGLMARAGASSFAILSSVHSAHWGLKSGACSDPCLQRRYRQADEAQAKTPA